MTSAPKCEELPVELITGFIASPSQSLSNLPVSWVQEEPSPLAGHSSTFIMVLAKYNNLPRIVWPAT